MAVNLADLVVRGARVWTGATGGEHGNGPTAFAVRDGRFLAVGSDDELTPLAGAAGRVVDLGGRRVLPGLADSHIHAVRAGLTWDTELHWENLRSVGDALASISARARAARPGEWVAVVGGWHWRQFAERRMPTTAELDAAAPGSPVYVQMGYECAVLSTAALRACGWASPADAPPGATFDADKRTGALTGVVRGMGAYGQVLRRIGQPSPERQRAGTAAMLAELAAHGLTAVTDAGGFLMTPESYQPVFGLWREGVLPVRVRLFISASTAGREAGELTAWMRHTAPGFGDDMLRISGIGELVHLGCHDMEGFDAGFTIPAAALDELTEISMQAAARGWPMSLHAVLDTTLSRVLDAWETVARSADLAALRWSIVHADQASPRSIERMAALGLGVQVVSRTVLQGPDYLPAWGAGQVRRAPPIGGLADAGIWVAAGSDSTRASWYLPWPAIWWLVTGSVLDDPGQREPAHRMSLPAALAAYTAAGSYLVHEETRRGLIAPGQLADFFVPTADPFTIPPDELPGIRSDWTVLGGHTTHDSGRI